MATETVMTCDVCGRVRAARYTCKVLQIAPETTVVDLDKNVDLCDGCAERLVAFTERGLSKPTPRQKK